MRVEIHISGNQFLELLRQLRTQESRAKIANMAKHFPQTCDLDGAREELIEAIKQVCDEGK